MATGEGLPRAVRSGRDKPLGAEELQTRRAIGRPLDPTPIFAATPLELPPRSAPWARVSRKQRRAGITGQVRLRAGDGGGDRVRVTGATGNATPYFRALVDREEDGGGQGYLCDAGDGKLAPYEAMRAQGREWVTTLPERLSVEGWRSRRGRRR